MEISKAEKRLRQKAAAGLNSSHNSDTSSHSNVSSPPPKSSRRDSPAEPTEAALQFQSKEQFSHHLQSLITDKFSSLTPDNRTLVDCISAVVYSFHSNSHSLLQSQFNSQNNTIQSLTTQLSTQVTQLTEQRSEISELRSLVNNLQTALEQQQKETLRLETYLDSIDSYQRRESLIFSGAEIPEELEKEDSAKVALNLLQSKLNYTIKPEEISIAHRLGPKSDKKRPIIVKFTRRSIKHNIVRKCVNIKPNFGVSESLSPYRRKIYSTLRTIKGPRGSNSDIQQLHTNDGTIVVKLTSSNSYHKINDEKSLTKFLDSHPNIKDKYIELISH